MILDLEIGAFEIFIDFDDDIEKDASPSQIRDHNEIEDNRIGEISLSNLYICRTALVNIAGNYVIYILVKL